ncbi:MAG: MoaD/ThiS family protein [Chloroflexi bacterium]|nr:MoaD/ThiS family protein [Chloroflexota bacterium]MCL5076288.1 MoaD/ThiS family protein [Chloroflexota bacterium]
MSVNVKIPTPLRRLTAGAAQVVTEGTTIRELIDDLEQQYPGFKERLCDHSGQLRRFINIYVDGEDIRFLNGLDTPVSTARDISIVPAMAGG